MMTQKCITETKVVAQKDSQSIALDSNLKIMVSIKNVEHNNGVTLFKDLN